MHKSIHTLLTSVALFAMILLLGTGTTFAFNFPGFGKAAEIKAINGTVTIPVAQVDDGKAHFFRFADGGKQIGFFVVKGSDGALHVAFDACDVCFQEKQGYVQDGANMVCKNCNRKFATNRIGKANSGGCNPSHLDFTQSAGNIVVKASDLQAGARYF